MKQNFLLIFFYLLLLNDQSGNAQTFIYDHQTSVIQGTSPLKFPFAGGLNTPQFSATDLNHDGQNDLFIFDRTGNKVLTFLNEGTTGIIDHFFWPDYTASYPQLINWAILLDYNCDGEEDIITSDGLGVKTYLAAYDGFSTTFTEDQIPLKFKEAGFEFDIAVGYIDIPGFADINFDGDIDVLTFNMAGGIVDYYENRQIEEGLPCGTWALEHVNSCWGNFYESGITYSVDLDYICKGVTSAKDGVHAGSTFMIFDQDADEDMDIVLGDLAFGNLNFITNGGDKNFANIIDQDTTFPSYSLPYDVQIFPAAFLIDLNNDDKKDMVVSPNNENISENFKNVWYYENVSTDETYIFDFQSDSFIVSEMVDVGDRSFPVFFDYNYDGLTDLVIGNKGYYDNGEFDAMLALFENTGSADSPAFTLITRDFAGLSIYPFNSICPSFADLDNDGDEDMIIGEEEGPIHYFKNTAGAGGPAEFILFAGNFLGIDPGQNSTPELFDINEDGLTDLILGEKNGNLNYYENTGSAEEPIFTLQNEFWGNVDVRIIGSLTGHSVPELIKRDGQYELYVGCEDGTIFQYDPTIDFTGAFTKITSTFNATDEGSFSSVRLFDLNGDAIDEMMTGNERGGITLYRDASTVSIDHEPDINVDLFVYPNPAQTVLTIESLQLKYFDRIIIYDLSGRVISSYTINGTNQIQIQIGQFANGLYIIECLQSESGENFKTKFIKN